MDLSNIEELNTQLTHLYACQALVAGFSLALRGYADWYHFEPGDFEQPRADGKRYVVSFKIRASYVGFTSSVASRPAT